MATSVFESPTITVVEPPPAARDRLDERLRIGLANSERVLAADEGEAVEDAELAEQQLGRMLHLVGADGEAPAGGGAAVEAGDDAGKQRRAVGDVGVVMGEKVDEQALERRRVDLAAQFGEATLDQRPAAGAEQATRRGDRQGRDALSGQHEFSAPIRSGAVSASVPSRSKTRVAAADTVGASPQSFQKSGSVGASPPPMRKGAMRRARPSGPVSTATPHSVASPPAGSKRRLNANRCIYMHIQ